MSKFRIQHTKTYQQFKTDANTLRSLLSVIAAKSIYLWDYSYWYVSLEDWGEIIRDVLLGMPKYTAEKFDCENFAMLTTTRVLERHQLNTMGIAIGKSPWGEHGYNLFVAMVDDATRLFILEPQTADIYPIEQPEGYKPRIIILG
jgi:hypothetical protein